LQFAPNFLARVHILAAWQGREREASELIQAIAGDGGRRGEGAALSFVGCADAVLMQQPEPL
jgi:hypothetical protein